ncbi:HSP20 family molecular chaperone IbpA [Halorubrum alkaliphilum]|uniref:HSP20 family molecular chaperone IbpA n=1 Tax=Halorubrum alkaliphilum TaxID=261290 RepID=A0A8T4GGT0_9EURY|nr:Hsp20/alpha crystallin family protein [Halorubrum alkaliphilum]MBP1922265.1 HSP20 family molecular chaperone IbpA [Halorubrum alkaliphilum]
MSALRDALRDLPDAVFADLLESDDEYVLLVDLPGATAETTEVLFEDGRIEIEGRREKSTPEGFRYVREDRPLFLDAELPLPPDADGDAADAEMDRGVLEVVLPKRIEGDSRRIPVDGGDEATDESVGDTGDTDDTVA